MAKIELPMTTIRGLEIIREYLDHKTLVDTVRYLVWSFGAREHGVAKKPRPLCASIWDALSGKEKPYPKTQSQKGGHS